MTEEIAAMARFNARTLAAGVAALVLSAHGAKAETYAFGFVPPCYTCDTIPKPQLPDLLGQAPKFQEPARHPSAQARMNPAMPGARNADRRRP
jgi:hypothetical protein